MHVCNAPNSGNWVQYSNDIGLCQMNSNAIGEIGVRLREERSRRAPTQGEFANILGVKQGTYSSWETGAAKLRADNLIMLAGAGIDILYVLTGRRGGELLGSTESQLLDSFRRLSEPNRIALLQITSAMTGREINLLGSQNALSSAALHDHQPGKSTFMPESDQ